jgi:hypothetical protein
LPARGSLVRIGSRLYQVQAVTVSAAAGDDARAIISMTPWK